MSDVPQAKILVVDDNETNRALAQSTLEDEGYAIVQARGGAEALTLFESEAPDCILLDVRMPDLDGLEVCARIRQLPGGAEVPVLFLTALRDIDTFDKALAAGGNDFLTKPVRPAELVVRVQTALKLRRMSAELRGHYDLLKRQRDDLLRLQLQKERLMAFVVHDLKNPVNAMDLQAQLLLREEDLSPTARESARQIRNEARQLTRMIVNLLDVAKADEGQLAAHRKSVALGPLVAAVLAELQPAAESRGVALESTLAVDHVFADEDLLRRTLTNLVENAIRYAPPESRVGVSARREGPDATELQVRDAGSGVPESMRERIFEPFVQVEAGTTLVARTSRGLGLAFCKRAVLAHGGSISVEDAAPGTLFRVRLPDG